MGEPHDQDQLAMSDELRAGLDECLVKLARRPAALRGGVKVGPIPPRLWEGLRLALQTEYRRATGQHDAILTVAAPEKSS